MLPGKQSPRSRCRGHFSIGKLSAALLILIALGALAILWLNPRKPTDKPAFTPGTNLTASQDEPPATKVPVANPPPEPGFVSNAAVTKGRAETPAASEALVRIAMLYNMTKYIEWPSSAFQNPGAPFVMGVFGSQSSAEEIQKVIGEKRAAGRAIVVKSLGQAKNSSATDWKTCHMLFVPASEASQQTVIIQAAKGLPILSAGEGEAFLQAGGIVAFPVRDGRMEIDLNEGAAEEAGLKPNAGLVKIARKWPAK